MVALKKKKKFSSDGSLLFYGVLALLGESSSFY